MNRITVEELNNLIGTVNILDVRDMHELREGKIPTSKHIPVTGLMFNHSFFLDKSLVVYFF